MKDLLINGPDGPITDFSPLACIQRLRDWAKPVSEREWRSHDKILTQLRSTLRNAPLDFEVKATRLLQGCGWEEAEAAFIAHRLCQHSTGRIYAALDVEDRLAHEKIGEFTPPEPGGYLRWKGT